MLFGVVPNNAYHIARIIMLLLIWTIYLPLICYYTYKYYKNKISNIIQFRCPSHTFCLNLLIIFGFMVNRIQFVHIHHIRYMYINLLSITFNNNTSCNIESYWYILPTFLLYHYYILYQIQKILFCGKWIFSKCW